MSDRTTETSVTFRHPFKLASFDTEQPAGTYRLVTDEEEVLGLSFLAYRRVATMLHTPSISAAGTHGRRFSRSIRRSWRAPWKPTSAPDFIFQFQSRPESDDADSCRLRNDL